MYVALVHKDADSDYGVMFPDLPGCVSAGRTVEAALSEARLALALHLEGFRQDGEVVPPARSIDDLLEDPEFRSDQAEAVLMAYVSPAVASGKITRINLSVDTGQLALIDQAASAAGMNRSAFMVSAALSALAG